MNIENIKTPFPFVVSKPRDMSPMEQIICMMWLAHNYSLSELRDRQELINLQIQIAHKRPLTKELANLIMMLNTHCAAIAYQQFINDNVWMGFIRI